MKKNLLMILTVSVALLSCKKDYHSLVATYDDNLSNKAYLKVIDVTVGAVKNMVYADGTPLTGSSIASGGYFPATTNYAAINAGSSAITIKDTSTGTAQKLISAQGSFNAGAYYTIFTYDTSTNASYVLTTDDITVPTDGTARLRFANMVYSRTGTPPIVDIYSSQQQKNIFNAVNPAQVTDFISVPTVTDTLFIRATGTITNLAQFNAFTAGAQHSYTLVFSGVAEGSHAALIFTNR